MVIVPADGKILYTPTVGFVGNDSFQYRVSDDSGRSSGLATVNVIVRASRLQNSANPYDVNGDGVISPLDPLLVINYLAASGSTTRSVPPDAVGPDYLDVSGDGMISVNDALISMDQLSKFNNGSGEGEQTPLLAPVATERNGLRSRDRDTVLSVEGEFVLTEKLMLSNCFPIIKDDIVDLLAGDQDGASDDEELATLDEVLADLI